MRKLESRLSLYAEVQEVFNEHRFLDGSAVVWDKMVSNFQAPIHTGFVNLKINRCERLT